VRNLGDEDGKGSVHFELIDRYGNIIYRLPGDPADDPVVEVPAINRGGEEGIRFEIVGTKALNDLIDSLDRDNKPYTNNVVVDTIGEDVNQLDNRKGKIFNVDFSALPDSAHTYRYFIVNPTSIPLDLAVYIESKTLPEQWRLVSIPENGENITIAPGQTYGGVALLRTPPDIEEGTNVELRFNTINKTSGKLYSSNEWFLSRDTILPQIIAADVSTNQNNTIVSELGAFDSISGIKEASGVKVEFSTDGGNTSSDKVMAYTTGKFIDPTEFISRIGPFKSGAEVKVVYVVSDTAGNVLRTEPSTITIPNVTVTPEPVVAFQPPVLAFQPSEPPGEFPPAATNKTLLTPDVGNQTIERRSAREFVG
jgi:hypothetical protein